MIGCLQSPFMRQATGSAIQGSQTRQSHSRQRQIYVGQRMLAATPQPAHRPVPSAIVGPGQLQNSPSTALPKGLSCKWKITSKLPVFSRLHARQRVCSGHTSQVMSLPGSRKSLPMPVHICVSPHIQEQLELSVLAARNSNTE